MKSQFKLGATAAGGVAVSALAARLATSLVWTRRTARVVRRMAELVPAGGAVTRFWSGELAGLPEPVVRYFAFALTPGQPLIRRARLEQRGEFLIGDGADWNPFKAVEHFAVHPPGFVWDASIRVAPLVAVRVRDSYFAGEGAMLGRLAGLVPVASQRGTRQVAAGALARYLAEAAWLPTALLPSAGVSWSALDTATARARLSDRGTTVSLDFHFGEAGEILGISGPRYRAVGKTQVLTSWEASFREYDRVNGMAIPHAGEAAWILPEGRFPYWRGRITSARYEFAVV